MAHRPGLVLGEKVSIDPSVSLGSSDVSIGRGTIIHRNCVFKGFSPIVIGNYCAIAEGAHLISSNHAVDVVNLNVALQKRVGAKDQRVSRGPITIGHNVWLGDNAIVLSGVAVGNGAVVGAGAVVSRDVEPFAIVAGNPAREIRKRLRPEVISMLEGLAWWEWSEEAIRAKVGLFDRDPVELLAASQSD